MSGVPRSIPRSLQHASRRHAQPRKESKTPTLLLAIGVSATCLYAAHESRRLHLEEGASLELEKTPTDWRQRSQLREKAASSFFWGLNRFKIAAPHGSEEGKQAASNIKRPRQLPLLDGLVLRDLRLHEQYAVAVDEKGDVLQWGDGHHDEYLDRPHTVLAGKNIVKVAPTRDKIYALSKSGTVFCFAVDRQTQRDVSNSQSRSWWQSLWRSSETIDTVTLTTDVSLSVSDKVEDISAGESHLMALTAQGRLFACPVDRHANEKGQLGVRQVRLKDGPETLHPIGFEPEDSSPRAAQSAKKPAGLIYSKDFPRAWLPEDAQAAESASAGPSSRVGAEPVSLLNDRDIRFCTVLHEVPSLKTLRIAQVATGDCHTLVKTTENRVLGFGSNNYGQLGLGTALAFPVIPTPSEVLLARAYSKDAKIQCQSIAAGGQSTYFIVQRNELKTNKAFFDVLACGNGQFGGIGNGQWSHQGAPVRVKTISGLQEWSDSANALLPIPIHDLSVGKNHVVAILDNAVVQKDARYGRDVFVWGQNAEWQLGNGRRSNLAVPQHLPPLPDGAVESIAFDEDKREWNIESRMPHHRLQLTPATKHGRHVVEETMVAGWNTTAVFWKIVG